MGNILGANGLVKRYPTFTLDSTSFSLPEGCITGFIGVNGAGKTTTIRSILNLAHKESRTIKTLGLDTDKYEREIKDRLGIIMNGSYFYDDLSMEDMRNIVAPAYSKWGDVEYRIYMEKFGLDPKQKIPTLSDGMRMKFALMLALSHQAKFLIMDEPTSGLDPFMRRQFLEIITDYVKGGGEGVSLSIHITSDLDKVADVLILIDGGKIVSQQNKNELLDTFRIVKGSVALLNDRNKRLIKNLKISTCGLSALTDRIVDVKKEMSGVSFEKAGIEDIMLVYAGGKSDGR